MTTLLVIAKAPVPGRVKTRLTPPFSPADAAALAEAALRDTLDTVCAAPADRRVLALEGAPGPWLPPDVDVVPQRGRDLDERIASALAEIDGPVLVVGMDTPQLTAHHLQVGWDDHDAWFGPAVDGGFWALGLRESDPTRVFGVPMSRSDTGAHLRARLTGLRVGQLPTLTDVDTAADAAVVAGAAPTTRFAQVHARLSLAAGRV